MPCKKRNFFQVTVSKPFYYMTQTQKQNFFLLKNYEIKYEFPLSSVWRRKYQYCYFTVKKSCSATYSTTVRVYIWGYFLIFSMIFLYGVWHFPYIYFYAISVLTLCCVWLFLSCLLMLDIFYDSYNALVKMFDKRTVKNGEMRIWQWCATEMGWR